MDRSQDNAFDDSTSSLTYIQQKYNDFSIDQPSSHNTSIHSNDLVVFQKNYSRPSLHSQTQKSNPQVQPMLIPQRTLHEIQPKNLGLGSFDSNEQQAEVDFV